TSKRTAKLEDDSEWGDAVEEEDDGKVDTLQITYIDPLSGEPSQQNVYCDLATWVPKATELRFLISSDLINLLTESHLTRHARWKDMHQKLGQTRIAFLCEIRRIRVVTERLNRAIKEEEAATKGAHIDSSDLPEPCGVHFYAAESYIDQWTEERLSKANDAFAAWINTEVVALNSRVAIVGGGSWKNLMWYGMTFWKLPDVGVFVMNNVEFDWQRKLIENTLTGGVWDDMDWLQPIVDDLQDTLKDMNARSDVIQHDTELMSQGIAMANAKIEKAEEFLRIPDPEPPSDHEEALDKEGPVEEEEDSEPETEATLDGLEDDEELKQMVAAAKKPGQPPLSRSAVEKMRRERLLKKKKEEREVLVQERAKEQEVKTQVQIAKLITAWEEKMVVAKSEVKTLAAPLSQAEVQLEAVLGNDYKKATEMVKAVEAQAEQLAVKAVQVTQEAEVLKEEVYQTEQKVKADKVAVEEIAAEVKELPPPDPKIKIVLELKKEYKSLLENAKKFKITISDVQDRIDGIKEELKKLLKLLGWVAPESGSSEEDGDEKPYWRRRKIAQNNPNGFDEREFLYKEHRYQLRKMKKRVKDELSDRADKVMTQLQAKRSAFGPDVRTAAQEESKLLPFSSDTSRAQVLAERGDSVERAIATARRRLMPPKDELPRPTPLEGEPRQTARLQQLRDALESKLRSCAACFAELLPQEGVLGELRPRLKALVDQLQAGYEDMLSLDDSDDVERQLEEITAALHGLIGEAVGLGEGDQQEPTSAALRNSLEFGELRKRLSEVRAHQRQLLAELRFAAGRGRGGGLRRGKSRGEFPRPFDAESSPRQLDGESLLAVPLGLSMPRGMSALCASGSGGLTQGSRAEVADFGFRPDGHGEESLENWPLFKVSKNSLQEPNGGGSRQRDDYRQQDSVTSIGSRSMLMGRSSFKQTDPKAARLQRVAADCDFRDYMTQMGDNSGGMGRSASAPDLEVKKGPSLPELVKKNFKPKDPYDILKTKGATSQKSPSSIRSSKNKLRATAPPDFGWLSKG
ncbi:unnamed protein product, partial [Polarella glacialis]